MKSNSKTEGAWSVCLVMLMRGLSCFNIIFCIQPGLLGNFEMHNNYEEPISTEEHSFTLCNQLQSQQAAVKLDERALVLFTCEMEILVVHVLSILNLPYNGSSSLFQNWKQNKFQKVMWMLWQSSESRIWHQILLLCTYLNISSMRKLTGSSQKYVELGKLVKEAPSLAENRNMRRSKTGLQLSPVVIFPCVSVKPPTSRRTQLRSSHTWSKT